MKIKMPNPSDEYKSILLSSERNGVDNLIRYLEKTDFFVCPASTKYHLNIKHGLVKHSLNTYYSLKFLYENAVANSLPVSLQEDNLIISSLLHDLCKINTYTYDKKSKSYIYNPNKQLILGHGEESIYIASKFISLTNIEAMMIRWHMGAFDGHDFVHYQKPFKNYINEILLFHMADLYATYILDRKNI